MDGGLERRPEDPCAAGEAAVVGAGSQAQALGSQEAGARRIRREGRTGGANTATAAALPRLVVGQKMS